MLIFIKEVFLFGWFGDYYRIFGVDGLSLRAVVVKLNMTTNKHSKIGPNIAPSHPSQNIPPAIDRPVKYACPPLKKQNFKILFISPVNILYDGRLTH